MAVKPSRLMVERIGDMLVRDKMGVHEGFLSAFSADIARVVGDYFELSSPPAVSVRRGEDGGFEVSVTAEARRLKRFETTSDLPKPEL